MVVLTKCMLSAWYITYSPTYALTYLSAQLPGIAFFFTSNQYLALWILPPKYPLFFQPHSYCPQFR